MGFTRDLWHGLKTWWIWTETQREFKVKHSPECNLGFFFFYECIWVKPSCKGIFTMKEALLRLTVFLFSTQTHFQWECMRHFYASIKISISKTPGRLDTTWNFARSINLKSASCCSLDAFTRRFDSYTFTQKKPRLHFGASFSLTASPVLLSAGRHSTAR